MNIFIDRFSAPDARQCLHSTAADDDAALVERAAAFLEARRSGICR